jgi:hypothetical protein
VDVLIDGQSLLYTYNSGSTTERSWNPGRASDPWERGVVGVYARVLWAVEHAVASAPSIRRLRACRAHRARERRGARRRLLKPLGADTR